MAKNTVIKVTDTSDLRKEVSLWARTIFSVGKMVKSIISLFKSS